MVKKTEATEQSRFVAWFRATYPGVLIFHVPNGGARSKTEGLKFKQMGVTPGVPDLIVAEWKTVIEMKEGEGRLTAEQSRVLDYFKSIGWYAFEAHGFECAKECAISVGEQLGF